MQRSTRQLVTTLEVLAAASDHPTAEQILLRVRARLPRVSLGTVYRNLEKLRAQGRLRVVNIGPGVARYDALLTEHDHFLCDACGAVIDVAPLPDSTGAKQLRRDGYVVRMRSVVAYGLCRQCARSEHEARTGANWEGPTALPAVPSPAERAARTGANREGPTALPAVPSPAERAARTGAKPNGRRGAASRARDSVVS